MAAPFSPIMTAAALVLPETTVGMIDASTTRNPMYLGHLIFMLGLAVTFWSWFALVLLVARAAWFHGRVLRDEQRLDAKFGEDYAEYCRQVRRWIPGLF